MGQLVNVSGTEDLACTYGPARVYLTAPDHGEPLMVALTYTVPVACERKFMVKVMLPPACKLCLDDGEIFVKVAPVGPPEL